MGSVLQYYILATVVCYCIAVLADLMDVFLSLVSLRAYPMLGIMFVYLLTVPFFVIFSILMNHRLLICISQLVHLIIVVYYFLLCRQWLSVILNLIALFSAIVYDVVMYYKGPSGSHIAGRSQKKSRNIADFDP